MIEPEPFTVYVVERMRALGDWRPMSGAAYATRERAEAVRTEVLRSIGDKKGEGYRVSAYRREAGPQT